MRLILLFALLLVTACTSYPPAPFADAQVQLVNTVHAGDQLRVVVMDEPGLSGVYNVDAQGEIRLPMAGAVPLSGLTLSQAGRAISNQLEKGYLKQPQIAVSFDKQRDIYVLGEVQRPGNYSYTPGLTVVKAIAQAGGYTYRAANNNMLLRRHDAGSDIQKYSAEEDTILHPGDSLTVRERFF